MSCFGLGGGRVPQANELSALRFMANMLLMILGRASRTGFRVWGLGFRVEGLGLIV